MWWWRSADILGDDTLYIPKLEGAFVFMWHSTICALATVFGLAYVFPIGLVAQSASGIIGEAGGLQNQQELRSRRHPPAKATERGVVVFTGDRVIPQIADGAGWKTSFSLVNLENRAVSFQVYFLADNGTDLILPVVGQGPVRGMNVTLGPTQSGTFETLGTAAGLATGWALIGPAEFTDSVGGIAVFRQRVAGRPDMEAVVPIVNQFDRHFVLLFDNTGGFVTSAAFANPTLSSVVIPIVIRDESGAVLERRTMSLGGFSHTAFELQQVWPSTRGRRGAVEVLTSGFGVGALGLRFNPGGAFTSFHVLTNFSWTQ